MIKQFFINPYSFEPPRLLDTYTGAAAAYSLRRLNSAYTGPVVQVRRSGDSAEDTFSATEVGDGTLAAWVTAGGGTEDGFVKNWYDQSGNDNDAIQTTAARQPLIVQNGSLLIENGKPAIVWSGAEVMVSTFGATLTQPNEIYSVARKTNAGYLYDGIINGGRHAILRDFPLTYFAGSTEVGTGINQGTQDLITLLFSGVSSFARLNGSQTGSGNPGNNQLTGITIGSNYGAANNFMAGTFQELIIFNANKSADRTAIESNIATNYGITLS